MRGVYRVVLVAYVGLDIFFFEVRGGGRRIFLGLDVYRGGKTWELLFGGFCFFIKFFFYRSFF